MDAQRGERIGQLVNIIQILSDPCNLTGSTAQTSTLPGLQFPHLHSKEMKIIT